VDGARFVNIKTGMLYRNSMKLDSDEFLKKGPHVCEDGAASLFREVRIG
jgi:hypothetical protein